MNSFAIWFKQAIDNPQTIVIILGIYFLSLPFSIHAYKKDKWMQKHYWKKKRRGRK